MKEIFQKTKKKLMIANFSTANQKNRFAVVNGPSNELLFRRKDILELDVWFVVVHKRLLLIMDVSW